MGLDIMLYYGINQAKEDDDDDNNNNNNNNNNFIQVSVMIAVYNH